MNKELELLKRVKDNTLEKIINKYGTHAKTMADDKLSILDVKEILYEVIKTQADSIMLREREEITKEFSR